MGDQVVAAIRARERLMSTGFLTFSSRRSYTVAGSFVRFLIDEYGIERVRQLYRSGGDFQGALGRAPGSVFAAWRAYIEGVELPPGAAQIIQERFRRPAIFERACPHAMARKRAAVVDAIARGDGSEAIDLGTP